MVKRQVQFQYGHPNDFLDRVELQGHRSKGRAAGLQSLPPRQYSFLQNAKLCTSQRSSCQNNDQTKEAKDG